MLTYDGVEFDLNSLFHLNYSFDILKNLIEAMAKNQKAMQQKIDDLEGKFSNRDRKIEENERRLKNVEINIITISQGANGIENIARSQPENVTEDKSKTEEEKSKIIGYNVTTNADNDHHSINAQAQANAPTIIKEKIIYKGDYSGLAFQKQQSLHTDDKPENQQEEVTQENENQKDMNALVYEKNDIITYLMKRVSKLEKKLDDLQRLYSGNYQKNNEKSQEDRDLETVADINDLKVKHEELFDKMQAMTTNLDQINVKISDFNVYELFKSSGEEGQLDAAKTLVMALEAKVFKKFSMNDEKLKKLEEENFKNRNELTNTKNLTDSNFRGITNLKEEIKKFMDEEKILNEYHKDKEKQLASQHDEAIKRLSNQIDEKVKELKDMLATQEEQFKKTEEDLALELIKSKQNIGGTGTEIDLKIIKDMNKKINELERALKAVSASINMDSLRDEIKKLKEELSGKAHIQEFYEMNDRLNSFNYSINNLKETSERLVDDNRKTFTDVNWIMKKIESISAQVLALKNDEANYNQHRANLFDANKFVEVSSFNEFLKVYNKEADRLKREDDDLRRYIDELLAVLKTKASDRDLKNLEEFLMSKLEELKIQMTRKFADKIDTQKSIKYIDSQLKHIVEVYIKKMEKGDNWLLAKKPFNGYTCASCEAYIGDLHDKDDFIAWNKYPIREANEKAYRMGNGFSRMLQLLSLDIKRSAEMTSPQEGERVYSGSDSEEEQKRPQSNMGIGKKKPVLPKVKIVKHAIDAMNMSADDIEKECQDPNAPKVVKIYKKIKAVNEIPNPNNSK